MPSQSNVDWIESLSPWPEEFGLDRMRALLTELGDPQRSYPSIHVVGTNGKTTATRTIDALLRAAGLRVGSYTSPHVSGWEERIHIDGGPADFEAAIAYVRRHAERNGATQFEVLTAAALAEFAQDEVDVAVLEAGLGGRHDATNVVDASVVLLTNVSLEHTDVLGDTREAIAAEKLAVAGAAHIVVLPDDEFASLVQSGEIRFGGPRETAEAFVGRAIDADVDVHVPGRFERRGDEVWDGAHTPEAAAWLLQRLPRRDYVLCVSILRDKDADGVLARLAAAGSTIVATKSSNPRALGAHELGALARRYFAHVEVIERPEAALERAHELGEHVLVTGSLYLLADLSVRLQGVRWGK
jgi:dihydrofolate synthase / folylpolyglutamate synthase